MRRCQNESINRHKTRSQGQREAAEELKRELLAFSDLIDGRGTEELPELENGDDARAPEVGID